jgi:hypothetical protein
MDAPRNEVHITFCQNGHVLNTDCWCEPNRVYWYRNNAGIMMLVVEHNDETTLHRQSVLAARELDYFGEGDGDPDAPWVSRCLNDFNMTIPRNRKENLP